MYSPPRRLLPAVLALFALDGTVFGSWAARVPDVSRQVNATPTTLGIALLCISLGALAAMPPAARLCTRLGAGRVAAASAAAISAGVFLPAAAGSMAWLCVALLLFGAATGAVNVAANSVGVRLQASLGRPVMSMLHAGFSLGGLGGALIGGLAAAVLPGTWHLVGVATAGLLVALALAPTLRASDRTAPEEAAPQAAAPEKAAPDPASPPVRHGSAARALLVALGTIAGCTAFAEGAVTDWAALHLRENLHAAPTVAAAGYAGFSVAMAAGRLAGRHLVLRLGDTALLAGGGLVAALGLLSAALTGSVPVALAGYLLAGLGLANVFPLAIGRAGLVGGARGVAVASSVGYGGLLAGPAAIGLLAGQVGLPSGLAAVSVPAVAAAALAVGVDARLPRATSVAATLRARARLRLEPTAVRVSAAARRHAADLTLLTDQRGPSPRPYPGLEFLTV